MNEGKMVTCRCGKPMVCTAGHTQTHKVNESGKLERIGDYGARYICSCGWEAPIGYGSTMEEAVVAAYEAATRRPPNRMLVVVPVYPELPKSATAEYYSKIVGYVSVKQFKPLQGKNVLYISGEQPTPADIEAARSAASRGKVGKGCSPAQSDGGGAMNKYWLSWYAVPNRLSAYGNFELRSPWWVSGVRCSDDAQIICAAILAESADAAKEIIFNAYDKRPRKLEFRFVELCDDDWSPFNARFQRTGRMEWE